LVLSLAGLALAQEKVKKEETEVVSKPTTAKAVEAAKSQEAKGKEKAEKKNQGSPKLP
jgi:ActR/RegA family two-component response regulator